jgi:prepilin-type N-terminal cleavage/methylation domain-containing protein
MQVIARKSAGFTLIELLVVIAIIAVLIAILLPVTNTAREKSREARCIANMLQLDTALRAYKTDYGRYPFAPYYASGAGGGIYIGGWSALYPDYVSSKSPFRCPADPVTRRNQSDIPLNYCTYNGQIAATGATSAAAYWQFDTFTDSGNTRRRVCYNYFGFANDGWEHAYQSGTVYVPYWPDSLGAPLWLTDNGLKLRHYPRLMNRRAPGGDAETQNYAAWTAIVFNQGGQTASQWKMQK